MDWKKITHFIWFRCWRVWLANLVHFTGNKQKKYRFFLLKDEVKCPGAGKWVVNNIQVISGSMNSSSPSSLRNTLSFFSVFQSLLVFFPALSKSLSRWPWDRLCPTYSSGSRSSPERQSWRWRSPAARGHALQTGDICCPRKCRISSPRSRRSCRRGRKVISGCSVTCWPKIRWRPTTKLLHVAQDRVRWSQVADAITKKRTNWLIHFSHKIILL